MKRFLILTKAMTLMHLRNGYVLFWNFAFPILLMLVYGAVMSLHMNYMTAVSSCSTPSVSGWSAVRP